MTSGFLPADVPRTAVAPPASAARHEVHPVSVTPMPPEIAQAIVTVMGAIGKNAIEKGGENTFDGYKYASVDAFLAATNPACAAAGLIVQPIQIGVEKEQVESNGRLVNVMTFHYQFVLAHKSGATWHCPHDVRTIRLLWRGAQTSGMAQSYVLKQYMRALFQIATGDKDADAEEKLMDELPAQIASINAGRKAKGKPLTSKMVTLNLGRGPEPVAVDDVEGRVLDYFDGVPPGPLRKQWRAANQEGLEALHKFDKSLWLRIGQFLDAADSIE